MYTIILKVMELFLTWVFYNVSYLHTENISHYEATAIAWSFQISLLIFKLNMLSFWQQYYKKIVHLLR